MGVGDTEIWVDVKRKANVDTPIDGLGDTFESDVEMVSVDKESND